MRPTVPAVGLDSRRDRASDQAFRSLEGEEDDVRPAGGEKGTWRHLWSRLGPLLIWRPDTVGGLLLTVVGLGILAAGLLGLRFLPGPDPVPGPGQATDQWSTAQRTMSRRRRRVLGECGAVVHEPRPGLVCWPPSRVWPSCSRCDRVDTWIRLQSYESAEFDQRSGLVRMYRRARYSSSSLRMTRS